MVAPQCHGTERQQEHRVECCTHSTNLDAGCGLPGLELLEGPALLVRLEPVVFAGEPVSYIRGVVPLDTTW